MMAYRHFPNRVWTRKMEQHINYPIISVFYFEFAYLTRLARDDC